MRVTNSILADQVKRDVNQGLEAMQKLQMRMASGKSIQEASDDVDYWGTEVVAFNVDRGHEMLSITGTALVDDIVRTVQWANSEPAISVLVLTGDGSAFCSGGNVKQMQAKSDSFSGSPFQIQDQYRRGIQQLPLALHAAEIPIIAAVNGPAVGAGFDLACM